MAATNLDQETLDLLELETKDSKKNKRSYFTTTQAEDIRQLHRELIEMIAQSYKADPKLIQAVIDGKIYRMQK